MSPLLEEDLWRGRQTLGIEVGDDAAMVLDASSEESFLDVSFRDGVP